MLLRDYTLPEINRFIANCNFTESELKYFTLKAKDRSNVEISIEMNISEQQVSKLARRVKNKINRV